MAFNKLELHAIESTVGAMCRRGRSKEFKDELRTTYKIDGDNVLILEERRGRAAPENPIGWTGIELVRLRYIRSEDHWMLDWMHRGEWELYDPDVQEKDLPILVKIVEEDENGAFFG